MALPKTWALWARPLTTLATQTSLRTLPKTLRYTILSIGLSFFLPASVVQRLCTKYMPKRNNPRWKMAVVASQRSYPRGKSDMQVSPISRQMQPSSMSGPKLHAEGSGRVMNERICAIQVVCECWQRTSLQQNTYWIVAGIIRRRTHMPSLFSSLITHFTATPPFCINACVTLQFGQSCWGQRDDHGD